MKKGIQLDVRLRITGEAEPAMNWAAYTMEALRKMIEAGNAQYPGLTVDVRSIAENTNYEEDPWSSEEAEEAVAETESPSPAAEAPAAPPAGPGDSPL